MFDCAFAPVISTFPSRTVSVKPRPLSALPKSSQVNAKGTMAVGLRGQIDIQLMPAIGQAVKTNAGSSSSGSRTQHRHVPVGNNTGIAGIELVEFKFVFLRPRIGTIRIFAAAQAGNAQEDFALQHQILFYLDRRSAWVKCTMRVGAADDKRIEGERLRPKASGAQHRFAFNLEARPLRLNRFDIHILAGRRINDE